VYPGYGGRAKKAATKKFCLVIKKGEMFGLLGPNGAGKTTLISMLTGLYPANGGNAYIAGFDIKNRLDQVQLQMGVCPQFDILWKDLTVKEHLLFYARLKGISPQMEEQMADKAITEVKLERFANFKTKQLSGGMRRRLSVAISLVGEPKIGFLDEPSTGLDPENRRQLWDILGEARGKRAIILTTHSMVEADVLCNRIGIVTDGVLRCVGKQIRLKTLYGGGYHLFINCHRGRQLKIIQKQLEDEAEFKDSLKPDDIHQRVKDFVSGLLPNVILIQEFNGNFVFQVMLIL
jgi:ABC-type multidrug transport system ATPase subunit